MPIPYTLIRSDRKTISVKVAGPGPLVVRAPRQATQAQIEAFLKKHEGWIQEHWGKAQEAAALPPFTAEELRALAQQAAEDLPLRLRRFAPQVGVRYGQVTIRNQKTKWGSCTAQGNLNFNCLLMLCPPEVRDYVVVHELCHRKEMNHSPRFWAMVEAILPDYRQRRQWLKDEGGKLIARLP